MENQSRLVDTSNHDEGTGKISPSGDEDHNTSLLNSTEIEEPENVELQQIVVDQGLRASDSILSTKNDQEKLDEVISYKLSVIYHITLIYKTR